MLYVSLHFVFALAQTPREVYDDFRALGFDVTYFRIPVTDERSPKAVDFDTLGHYVTHAPESAALVFNCQMGRGRTTTAMIVASLLQVRERAAIVAGAASGEPSSHASPPSFAVPAWAEDTFLAGDGGLAEPSPTLSQLSLSISPPGSASQVLGSPLDEPLEDRLRKGDYLVIRSLLRVLERGQTAKAQIDAVIDACAEFQSLREDIVTYRARFLKAGSENQRNNLQVRFSTLLKFPLPISHPLFSV